MTIEQIIKNVRLSIDEEDDGSQDFVNTRLDNIIKSKINDAMRWVCLYADASLLGGSTGESTDNAFIVTDEKTISIEPTGVYQYELPTNYLRLIRVRVSSWKRGVSTTIEEDSDKYLEQSDKTAKADCNSPIVAIINDYPNILELYPAPKKNDKVNITYSISPSAVTISSTTQATTVVQVPPKVETSFVYYIAYLVMCAYNDVSKANTMLGVAKANLGGANAQTEAG